MLAYSLIVLMVVPLTTFIAWKRFHTRERIYRRRIARERLIDQSHR